MAGMGGPQARTTSPPAPRSIPLPALALLFLVSGFAALVYQVVWQRSLFAIYGVNIESVTIIVTAFLLGLGFGSLAGGRLSRSQTRSPLVVFGVLELSIGVFGLFSLSIFHGVGALTGGRSPFVTFVACFALLLLPTALMGATLPLLVAHSVRQLHNVGRSVALLYFVNTLGSALASFATAVLLLGRLGQWRTIVVAACLNAIVGTSALLWKTRGGTRS